MGHSRRLVLSGISLTVARTNRQTLKVLKEVRETLEGALDGAHFMAGAPFRWIGLSLRYGLKNEPVPHYLPIDEKDGELPIAIEMDTHELRRASYERLLERHTRAVLIALIHVGKRYDRPTDRLISMLEDLDVGGGDGS